MSQETVSHAGSGDPRGELGLDSKADYWQQKYGVPWSELAKAIEAVKDRSAQARYRSPADQQHSSSAQI
jgi:hypothetical protein